MRKTCTNIYQTCPEDVRIDSKINENRHQEGPKVDEIGVWMGLCPLFVVSGALGREFSGKLGGRCAKLGQDGSKLRPRWATMASRWDVTWTILGGVGEDFGGVLADFWEDFWEFWDNILLVLLHVNFEPA